MKYIHYFIMICLLLIQSQLVWAGDEEYVSSLKGSAIAPAASLVTADAWYSHMLNNNDWEDRLPTDPKSKAYDLSKRFTNVQVDGYVSLRWEGSEEVVFSSDWGYRVEVEIQSWNTQGHPMPTVTRWLAVNYELDGQQSFKDWDVFHLPGADRLEVQVLTIEYTDANGIISTPTHQPVMKEDLYLENKIKVKRVFSLDVQEDITIRQTALDVPNRMVTYSWDFVEGAEEYDFEWLYISKDVNTTIALDGPLGWQRATRVSLIENKYTIELPYDEGTVYFRARAVGYGNELGHRLIGNWSNMQLSLSIAADGSGDIGPLETEKNWTYQASYAEEGKRVEVLNFADGTGRARQSVTKDNSYNRTIVSETVFDREGRQAIQVIPSVAEKAENQLKFFDNYNLADRSTNTPSTIGGPIHWTDFDQDANYTFDQTQKIMKLSTISGSGRYFSPSNIDDKDSDKGAFVADAKGFPYTQTVFDNQGRVKLQSGVGETHAFGSGHETEYYYASVFQEDLDELFGSEIGYAEHYSMQMTKDPNGQLSISYTNLAGKTVATALVGETPKDTSGNNMVDRLDQSGTPVYRYPTSRVKTRNLLPEEGEDKKRSISPQSIIKEFMVSSPGNYDFHYTVNTAPFVGCDGVTVPCEFELKFNIYDSEGNVLNNRLSITSSSNNAMVFGAFFDVNHGDVFDFQFVAGLNDLKSYTIEKVLRLKDVSAEVEAFKDKLKTDNNSFLADLKTYYKDPVNITPPVHPNPCVDAAPLLDLTQVNLDPCDQYSGDPSDLGCEGIRDLLTSDLLPGGQYYEEPNWLENEISFPSNGITYQGVDYTDWAMVRALTYVEIKGFMEANNFFEYHPEWCLYRYQCVDNPDPNTNDTWYQALRKQDAAWFNLDLADALTNDYLTIPNGGICTLTSHGDWYGRLSYPMLGDIASQLTAHHLLMTTLPAPKPPLLDHIKWEICHYIEDGSNWHDLADLADLARQDPDITDELRWAAIRSMMLECKRRGINKHLLDKFPTGTCGGFLADADPNDGVLETSDGFSIRIPNYNDLVAQVENQTNFSGTVAQDNSIAIQNMANGVLNGTVGQNVVFGGSCTIYEARIDIPCFGSHSFQRIKEIRMDLHFTDPYLVALHGNSLTLLPTLDPLTSYGPSTCQQDVMYLQTGLNTQIATFNAPLNLDLNVIVTTSGTGLTVIAQLPKSNNAYSSASISATIELEDESTHHQIIRTESDQFSYANCKTKDLNILCDYYKLVEPITCLNNGSSIDLSLDLATSTSGLNTTYGTTSLDLGTITSGMLGNDCGYDLSMVQAALNAAVSALPSPLKDDIVLFAQSAGGNGMEIVLKLPDLTYNAGSVTRSNKYAGLKLVKTTNTPSVPATVVSSDITFFACDDQGYPTCVCEEIKQLKQEYSGYADIYDVIADRYIADLLLLPTALSGSDIQYIENTYCSASSTPAYPLGGYQDLQLWKANFKLDNTIPTHFKAEISKCLEIPDPLSCEEQALALVLFEAEEYIDRVTKKAVAKYERDLKTSCINDVVEEFELTYTDRAIHYTLYYYDASGNLERTVPPTGVDHLETQADLDLAVVERNRHRKIQKQGGVPTPKEPTHAMATNYVYNTLNEVVQSTAPDRGSVKTYYDVLGRPIFSQNEQQVLDKTANYICYDALGRIVETGLVEENATSSAGPIPLTFADLLAPSNKATFQSTLDNGSFPSSLVIFSGWTKSEVRKTFYNTGISQIDAKFEDEIGLRRNRVGAQTYSMDGEQIDYEVAYNYDVFGNAKEVWQHYPQLVGNEYKQLQYDYDLISGVVHGVDYQKGEKDQLSFRYTYDANNRLIKAKSSINGFIWNTDASYEYYYHGPLKRVELGEDKVQGLDYLYTMHGWIKGVNSNKLSSSDDPGRDGSNNSNLHSSIGGDIHDRIAQDIFGYTVHYYDGDYSTINSSVQNYSEVPANGQTGNLYNGNISSVTQAQTKPAIGGAPQSALPSIWKKYRYDQLHRLVESQTLEQAVGTTWGSFATGANKPVTGAQTQYTYGPNGNILSLKRYAGGLLPNTSPVLLDELTYNYNAGTSTLANSPLDFVNNKLSFVSDAATPPNRNDDLKSQSSANYVYDENGSLIADASEDIEEIKWTSEQKVSYVKRNSTNTNNRPDLKYIYDFQGNRISKIQIPNVTGQNEKHTVYVRDPQGNVLGIYEYDKKPSHSGINVYRTPNVYLKEQMVYGSDRLGIIKRNVQVGGPIKIVGDGMSASGTITPKIAVNSYLGHIESDPTQSYLDFDLERDEGVNLDEVIGLENLGIVAQDQLYIKSFPIFEQGDAVVQRLERMRGVYRYELKNFRGDVRQVINDVKSRENINGTIEYTANVIQSSDSYPFGWDIKERSFSTDQYRYGFQGQEEDSEWIGSQAINYKFRIHNSRLGRFLSIDPLAPSYPHNSPYAFSENVVINAVELEGLEKVDVNDTGINPSAHKNDDGTYSFALGNMKFDNVNMINRGGMQFFDLTSHLRGKGLYVNGEGGDINWSNAGTPDQKVSIDNDIFDPPYDKNWDCEGVNCAGLVFRENRIMGSVDEVKTKLGQKATPITSSTVLKEGDVVITLQEFLYTPGVMIDGNFVPLAPEQGPDFHIVSAPLGPQGRELPNVITTNGKRPIYEGLWLRDALVKSGDQYTHNNRYDTPAFHEGRPVIVIFRIRETKYKKK